MGQGRLQIEITHIVRHLPLRVEIHFQTTQREVFHAVRSRNEMLIDEICRHLLFASEDGVAHLFQVSQRLMAVVVVGTARPEGLLVELDFLRVGATIDHRTQMRVTHWQGFQPTGGRF